MSCYRVRVIPRPLPAPSRPIRGTGDCDCNPQWWPEHTHDRLACNRPGCRRQAKQAQRYRRLGDSTDPIRSWWCCRSSLVDSSSESHRIRQGCCTLGTQDHMCLAHTRSRGRIRALPHTRPPTRRRTSRDPRTFAAGSTRRPRQFLVRIHTFVARSAGSGNAPYSRTRYTSGRCHSCS